MEALFFWFFCECIVFCNKCKFFKFCLRVNGCGEIEVSDFKNCKAYILYTACEKKRKIDYLKNNKQYEIENHCKEYIGNVQSYEFYDHRGEEINNWIIVKYAGLKKGVTRWVGHCQECGLEKTCTIQNFRKNWCKHDGTQEVEYND